MCRRTIVAEDAMLMTTSEVSKTSAGPLFLRMKAGIPYARQLAELTQAERMLGQLIDPANHALMERYFASYMELRFWALTAAVRKSGCNNVLEVAAGFSPRGLIVSEDPGIRYVETDLAPVIEAKQAVLAQVERRRSNLRFAAADVFDASTLQSANRLLVEGSVALIHEGLLTYFPHEQKREVMKNFRMLLGQGDVWITPDIVTREQMERTTALSKQYLSKWPAFYPFEDLDEARRMINEAGFGVETLVPQKLVRRLKSPVPTRVRDILAHEELWLMRPR